MKRVILFFFLISVFILVKCQLKNGTDPNSPVLVPYPKENPTTSDKAALGKLLFFDKRLSKDGSLACANCHDPRKAFTDQLRTSRGIKGQFTERNAPSLLNAGFLKTIMFDAHLKSLEIQVIVPIQEKTEMGHNMKHLIPKLRAIPKYQALAKKIFKRNFDAYVLTRSIAAFERTLVSLNSRYDQFIRGNKKALTKSEQAGLKLFTEQLYCTQCHPTPFFTNFQAKNNGLYSDYAKINDKGRFRIHLDSNDIGKFKVPSLRNIELTYPYMHDGSLKSLEEVIAHYKNGGKKNPTQDKSIKSFNLSNKEKTQLLSFLKTLTDTTYLKRLDLN
jgi:cytochrome c peroxidase